MSKAFDAVAFMRRRREEIDREDEGLSWEERARKTRELLSKDPLWQECPIMLRSEGFRVTVAVIHGR